MYYVGSLRFDVLEIQTCMHEKCRAIYPRAFRGGGLSRSVEWFVRLGFTVLGRFVNLSSKLCRNFELLWNRG